MMVQKLAPGPSSPIWLGPRRRIGPRPKGRDVKHISHDFPLRAISGNWPTVAKLSGKTTCFGVLALLMAHRVWGPTPDHSGLPPPPSAKAGYWRSANKAPRASVFSSP